MQRHIIALPVALVAALALSACAGRPKPAPAVDAGPGPAPMAENYDSAPERGPFASQSLQETFAAEAGDRVYFALDSHSLEGEARSLLSRQADWLARNPQMRVLIAGSADERGTREYNLALGARRAAATKDFLVGRGVSASRIDTVSYGKERPIDPGSNEHAWARNRNAHTMLLAIGGR